MSCDCEPARFYTEVIRKSRKTHQCCECSRLIIKGEQYEHISMMVAEGISTHKTCLECSKVREWLKNKVDCCLEFKALITELLEANIISLVKPRNSDSPYQVEPEYLDLIETSCRSVRLKS